MNKILRFVSAAVIAGSFVLPVYGSARAQSNSTFMRPREPLQPVTQPRSALKNEDTFFDNHPGVQEDLRNNPRLVDNPEYMKNHPELREYFHSHPNIRRDWKEHPRSAMHREEKWQNRHPNQ